MTDVKENPYEGPNAEGNIERDLASFKAVSGMSTATEYLINMITALKNARHERDELEKNYAKFMNDCHDEHHKHVAFRDQSARIAALEKELARMSLVHDAVAQHRDICNDAVKERDVRVATLEAELVAAKETAQHWQGIAEQRRERADADLVRATAECAEAKAAASDTARDYSRIIAERDHATKIAQEENAKALVNYEECKHASDRALDLEQRLDEAIRHRTETNEEIKKLHAMIKAKGFCVEDSVTLHEFKTAWRNAREEIKKLTLLLNAERLVTAYANHPLSCDVWMRRNGENGSCSCGLDAARKAAETMKHTVGEFAQS